MNRKMVVVCILAAAALAFLVAHPAARAQVVGPVMESEVFPDFANDISCKKAYDTYMMTAGPLAACHDLDAAQDGYDIESSVAQALEATKCTTKECKAKRQEALDNAGRYQSQISLNKPNCPTAQKQLELTENLPSKRREVCKACQNKWPGKIGPHDAAPCK